MKDIKVHLQYPWKFPDSPYYKYLVENPPEGVEFLNVSKQKGVITNRHFFKISNLLKRIIRLGVKIFYPSMPNAHLSPKGDFDLIHCAHCLSKNTDKPWVADIEMNTSMFLTGKVTLRGKEKIRRLVMSNNCKKLLPWTEYAKQEILDVFPEFGEKLEVVYPAIPARKNLKKSSNKRLRILFVARYFDIKGGLIALEILERLRAKYGVEGIIVSVVPDEIKLRYPHLNIYNLMPQQELFQLMESSDLFLYPGSYDTFGFALLEAMSFGLPILTIITPNSASRKEIVSAGKTGEYIELDKNLSGASIGEYEERAISEIMKKAELFIKNRKRIEVMKKQCLKEISSGRFSLVKRNKQLRRIYEEAIRQS
ncbi:MAG: glycosyltransferase family 4 protein [Candidatus Pacearchaeota archaeon]|nr:glycosyltransferase family 4 protein [Candidatus Pacearchaeota archaeon]